MTLFVVNFILACKSVELVSKQWFKRDNVQNHRVAPSDLDFKFDPAGNSGAFFCYPPIFAAGDCQLTAQTYIHYPSEAPNGKRQCRRCRSEDTSSSTHRE